MELTRNLRLGCAGADVFALKTRLFELGCYGESVANLTHERFGKQTLEAVRSFQRARGLTIDGVAGPLTWSALFDGAQTAANSAAKAALARGEIPANIGETAALAIMASLASETDTRRAIVLDALSFAFDPALPRDYPLSLYIRGANLYSSDLSPYVITLSRIASGAKRQPEFYDGGRREMMERAVRADASITGADCSGGVVGLLRHARVVSGGFDLSADGFAASAQTKRVGKDELRCADLLHKSGHVGLYVGAGYAVEWMGGAYGCQLTKLAARRGWNFVTGRFEARGAWTGFLRPAYY